MNYFESVIPFIVFLSMSKYLDKQNEDHVFKCRLAWAGLNLLLVSVHSLIYLKICQGPKGNLIEVNNGTVGGISAKEKLTAQEYDVRKQIAKINGNAETYYY